MTRPLTTNLITRFVSKSTRLEQCLPKDVNKIQEGIKIPESNILSDISTTRTNNETPTLHNSWDNPNDHVASTIPALRVQPEEDFLDDSDITTPNPLDTSTEDLSDIGPYLTPTFTFAKYADKSHTIQQLVKLGVALYKIEKNQEMVKFILGLDFERDIKPYIMFLHDCGVPADFLGTFLTMNPHILREDMDDLHTRIRYLRAHEFSPAMVKDIICKNPKWLLYTTKDIDGRLGYFQGNFKLNGHQVRLLTVKGPKVVTYRMAHLIANSLTIKSDMEFDLYQTKALLLKLPKIWTKSKYACSMLARFVRILSVSLYTV